MNINLGNKIRQLRKAKNISQEVLAQYLGVSFQSVSKWENDTAMPDVTMIPAIASFFNVSTDELFDYNRMEREQKIMEICREAAEYRQSDPGKSEEMLRQGLKQFPGNDIILNNLLYTMRSPERSEEVINLCKSLIESTKEDDVKYDALRILAETYQETGQQALVKPTLEKIPEIYFSKVELAAKLLEGEEALEAALLQAMLSRDDLLGMLSRAAQLYHQLGKQEKANDYAELTRKVYTLFVDRTDVFDYHRGLQQEWLEESIWPKLAEVEDNA